MAGIENFSVMNLVDGAHGRPANGRAVPQEILRGALLVAMILIAYAPALGAGFIWDDEANVIDNTTLRSLDGLRQIWFVPRSIQQYYPLMYTSYWLEYQAWGLVPFGYHLVNVLLHAIAAVLVWRLLLRLQVPGAWLAAALFALHPVEAESVAWVTERKNVLSLALVLGAMLAYFRFAPPNPDEAATPHSRSRWKWYALSLVLFALALFAKTVVVTAPPVLLVIYWWKRGRIEVRDVVSLLPFFAVAVAMGLVTTWMETYHVGAWGEEWDLSPLERLLLAGRSLWFYIGKLLWPYPLAFFYPRFHIDPHAWWQYLFLAAAVLLPLALWQGREKLGRGPLAALLIYAGVMFPVLGFFNVYYYRFAFVSDHFQYHASIALISLFAAAVVQLLYVPGIMPSRAGKVACAALLLGFGVLTFRQTFIYHDLEILYLDTIAKNPAGWTAYANLSSYWDVQGRHAEALDLAREALRLGPHEPNTHNNMGVFLFNQGRRAGFQPGQLEEAITHLRETLQLDPERTEARKNLAVALALVGQTDEALQQWRALLKTAPGFAEAHFELANLLVARGEFPEAAKHYAQAVELQPEYFDAVHNLGAVLLQMGQVDSAIGYFEKALRIKPESAAARSNLEQARAMQARGHAP